MSEFDVAAQDQGSGPGEDGGGHRRRYLRAFKRLESGKMATLEHGMGTFPLVDLYELTRFQVVSSADEMTEAAWVQFYLYHTSDRRARVRNPDGSAGATATLDEGPATRIPFESALRAYGVRYGDDRHLGDVVVEFWDALFAPPSDPFDEESYSNSPWLDRRMGDRRSIGELKRGGEWDDLWFYLRPRKTVGVTETVLVRTLQSTTIREELATFQADSARVVTLPVSIEVAQLGPRVVGLTLAPDGRRDVQVMVLLRA